MNPLSHRNLWAALLLSCCCTLLFAAPGKTHRLKIAVTDKASREAIVMATCVLSPTGAAAVTDADGLATIANVPEGTYTLTIRYVGYQTIETRVGVKSDLSLTFRMDETSLALREVNVVARQKANGASTSTIIGRQAIDHLQASSLADIMQLIPGQLMGNIDLTQQRGLQLRTLSNNSTAAFGASIVVDGVPMSNNGALAQGQYSPTTFAGTDLRQVSADDIDQVEVVRGIPSAEYGDLTSGLVVVRSKVGVTPYQLRAKVTPELQNYSLGKGLNLGRPGILNVSLDYAKAWGDPRAKTRSFGRYTANVGWGFDISRKWHTDTKLRFVQGRDWTGNDPDAHDDGTYASNRNTTLALTHNGSIQADRPLMRTLRYTAGVTIGSQRSRTSSFAGNSTGLLPIITARETGYHLVPWLNTSYLATGITESRPGSVFLKVNDAFFHRSGRVMQSFKAGVEYHYDWNSGRGYYNADETRPLRPNSNGRPRAFTDVPGLHQLAAYAEDNLVWDINKVNRLRLNLGVRFTALQPFADVATTALSPRLNVAFTATRWLDVRAGIGLNSKTPGLAYLYPDKIYDDRVAANYMPQNDPAAQLLAYHTQVYDAGKSAGLRNATTTKVEAGIDVKLPWGAQFSLLAYTDRTPRGFGPATEYTTYYSDVFTEAQGLVVTPGAPTTIDYAHPARHDLVFMTTGRIGNTNKAVNRGMELDFDFGEVKALHTTFHLGGAWQESKTWSTALNATSVRTALLPAHYVGYGLTPFKVVYPSGQDYTRYRRMITTLRAVTSIPALRMVASLTAQAIWHDSNYSWASDKAATGWIDTQLVHHAITPDMRQGYLGMDGTYYATQPTGQASVLVSDLDVAYQHNDPTKNPVTWNLMAQLSKELGRFGTLSLYVNNSLYHEPFLRSNNSTTLSQRNTSSFGFGAELQVKL